MPDTSNCSAGAAATTSYGHSSATHPDDVTSTTDPNGHTTTFTYDGDGNLVESDSNSIASLGGAKLVTKYTYDRLGRLVSTVAPEGNKSGGTPNQHREATLYDDGGLTLSTFDQISQPQVDTFSRPNASTLGTTETGASWNVIPSDAVWSVHNGAASLTTASGTGIRDLAVINAYADGTFALTDTTVPGSNFGLAFRVQDVSNFWTLRALPSSSNWKLYKVVAGAATQVGSSSSTGTCCTAGQRISVTTSGSSIKAYISSSTSAAPTLLISATDSALSTATQAGVFAQDANDGAATNFTASKAGGGVTNSVYDADRDTISATDPDGNVTGSAYDANDELTTVTRPDSTALKYGYDAIGNRASYTDGSNNTTTWTYTDAAFPNSATSMQPPSPLTSTSYDYDALGRLSDTLQGTQTATYTYDPAGRLTALAYSTSTTPSITNVTYDNDGRRLSVTEDNGIGTSTWAYDTLGRVVSTKLGGSGLTVGYDYDLNGNTTKITYPNETNPVVQCYDEADRLVKIYDPTVPAATCSSSGNSAWSYDYDNNITSVTYQNGVTDARTYDLDDNITSMETKFGASSYGKFVYTRDPAGQVASTTTTGTNLQPTGTETNSYNSLNQLTGATSTLATRTYTYNAGDNLTRNDTRYQQFNGADELCWQTTTASGNGCASPPTGATTYSYNGNGDRTSMTAGAATTTFGYDQQNRLTSLTAGTTLASYSYMADGTRLSKTVSGTETDFTYSSNGGTPLLLQTQSGGGWTSYIYGPDGVSYERKNASVYRITTHDQLGSIRITTDSSGANQGTYSYDAYGNVIHVNGLGSSLQFAGQYVDTETGFLYLQARYYDPATGQFITRDPAFNQTLNTYDYVDDSPLIGVDPSGLRSCSVLATFNPFSSNNCLRTSAQNGSGVSKIIQKADPAYLMIDGYVNEWDAASNGCSGWTAFKYGAEGVAGAAGTALFAGGITSAGSALVDSLFNDAESLGSTGRTVAESLKEQLAMEQAMSEPEAGTRLPLEMTDPRWPAEDGWVKMGQNIEGVQIHYVQGPDGTTDDWKFK
ncbi:MAG TPA: RHS repeat-associated core domain-containing protein [Acidothermaceae bacterium]